MRLTAGRRYRSDQPDSVEMRVLLMSAVLLVVSSWTANGHPQPADSDQESSSDEHGQFLGAKKTNCSCGWTNKSKGRIVGGKKTEVNEYPYMGRLVIVNVHEYYGNGRCGVAILTGRHALTAAHCVQSGDRDLEYDHFYLLLGDRESRTKDRRSEFGGLYEVSEAIVHPQYSSYGWKNDIAIVVTEKEIAMSPGVGPVCLPTGPMHYQLVKQGATLRLAGWGKMGGREGFSETLLKISFKAVPLEVCQEAFPSTKIDLTVRNQICAQHATKGSCMGDSGGPLVWLDPETNRYTAVALVSFVQVDCKLGSPSTNTDIGYHLPWIQKTIADTGFGMQTCAKQD